MTNPLDPNQRFVVSCITRAQLAEAINDQAGEYTGTKTEGFFVTEDDHRLTNEVCQAYADFLHRLDETTLGESNRDEEVAEYLDALCVQLGLN